MLEDDAEVGACERSLDRIVGDGDTEADDAAPGTLRCSIFSERLCWKTCACVRGCEEEPSMKVGDGCGAMSETGVKGVAAAIGILGRWSTTAGEMIIELGGAGSIRAVRGMEVSTDGGEGLRLM